MNQQTDKSLNLDGKGKYLKYTRRAQKNLHNEHGIYGEMNQYI